MFFRYGLAVFLVTCLVGLVAYFDKAHGGQASQPAINFESMSPIEQQAWDVASQVVGTSKQAQEQFVSQLLGLYYKVKDHDFAIFCTAGGWGKKPLEADTQGQTWLVGIESELTGLGYNYYEVEDIRTGKGLLGYVFELKEQLTHYPSKAKELAAKIDFLTKHVSGLKVIITGQSNGAAYAGEVITRLQSNPEVYSIQIGIPFWHRVSKTGRSLVIDNNGVGADALTHRDIVRLIKANLVRIFILNKAPAFTPIDWLVTRAVLVFWPYNFGLGMEAPGHDYMWQYPGVGPVIQAFLVKNFSTR
ncbi:MAG: hypothetical protein WCD72_07845 [Dehalococcoidia bacterium]